MVVDTSSSNAPNTSKTTAVKIGEFNYQNWRFPTKDWIASAADKGFDSMSVMQPLMDIADALHACDGSRSQGAPSASGASSGSHRRFIPEDTSGEE